MAGGQDCWVCTVLKCTSKRAGPLCLLGLWSAPWQILGAPGPPAAGLPAPTSHSPERDFSCLLRMCCAWWFWSAFMPRHQGTPCRWEMTFAAIFAVYMCDLHTKMQIINRPWSGFFWTLVAIILYLITSIVGCGACWERKQLQNHSGGIALVLRMTLWLWCLHYLPRPW